ncbi:MAG: D-alanine--D-alanine ligase [Clostridia bacterium]|nr:D-alanine--D-alanine ligase [Clostridia bacterium]
MQTVVIVYGGESCEHDISVITALGIYSIAKRKYQTELVYYKNHTFWMGRALNDISFYNEFDEKKLVECRFRDNYLIYKKGFGEKKRVVDCVINACHGGCGEDGALSGFFDTVGISHTGSNVFGSSLFMDKAFSKSFFEKERIPTLKYVVVRKDSFLPNIEEMGYPLIVKPARQGSSVGIAIANNQEELEKAIEESLEYDTKVIVEHCLVDFREFNCAVCKKNDEILASEIEEPIFKKNYLDFYDKYTDTTESRRELPADISGKLREKIYSLAKRIYERAELQGVVRVDFLFDGKRLYVNEVNTIPGALGLYLFVKEGQRGEDVLSYMIDQAIQAHEEKELLRKDFASEVLKNYRPTGKGGVKK